MTIFYFMFGEIYYKMRFFVLPIMVVFVMMGGFLFYEKVEACVNSSHIPSTLTRAGGTITFVGTFDQPAVPPLTVGPCTIRGDVPSGTSIASVNATQLVLRIPANATIGNYRVGFHDFLDSNISAYSVFEILASSANISGSGAAVRPIIGRLNPGRVKANGPGFVLDVHGFNFLPDAKAFFDGIAKVTSFINQNLLKVDVAGSDIFNPGERKVSVKNSPGTIGESVSEYFGTLYVDAPTPEEKGLKVMLHSDGAFDVRRGSGLKEVSGFFTDGISPKKEILRVSLGSLNLAFAAKTTGVIKVIKDGVLEQEKNVLPGIFTISLATSEAENSRRNFKFVNSGGFEVFDIVAVFDSGRLVQIFTNNFVLSSADIDGLAMGGGVFTVKATGLDGKFTNLSVDVVVQ